MRKTSDVNILDRFMRGEIAPGALLFQADAGAVLGMTPRNLARLRATGEGPRFIKVGARVAYRMSDLSAWLDARTVTSNAEARRKLRAA
jgi:predicted DNA-binding transcriptional regulator AlpA